MGDEENAWAEKASHDGALFQAMINAHTAPNQTTVLTLARNMERFMFDPNSSVVRNDQAFLNAYSTRPDLNGDNFFSFGDIARLIRMNVVQPNAGQMNAVYF